MTVGKQGHPQDSPEHLGIEKADMGTANCQLLNRSRNTPLGIDRCYQWAYLIVKVKIMTTGFV